MRPSSLFRLLARVRRIALRRAAATVLLRGCATLLLLGAFALTITAWTLRGDRVAPAAAALGVGALIGITLHSWRHLQARTGTRRRCAETLLRCADSPLPADTRSDLLGALELWERLQGQNRRPASVPSRELALAYVAAVDARLAAVDRPRLLPPFPASRRLAPLALALALAGLALLPERQREALPFLLEARDGRPLPPPAPLWSNLTVTLNYPSHTRRPPQILHNPSGTLRIPVDTKVTLDLQLNREIEAPSLVIVEDLPENSRDMSLETRQIALEHVVREDESRAQGTFTIRAPGTWSLTATVDGDERSSPVSPWTIEPDEPPEVELLPLAGTQREVSELDQVELRFRARDDFGFAGADLVFTGEREEERMPEEENPLRRLSLDPPPDGRTWDHRYTWNLSEIEVEEREAIEFWIEVRDNDPRASDPESDQPGKVGRSTRMRLTIQDREATHARNIDALRELRDAAVDHLALRMLTPAFARSETPTLDRLRTARELMFGTGALLTELATVLDRVAVDPLTRERDATTLAAVHARIRGIFVEEEQLHAGLAADLRAIPERRARNLLPGLASTNGRLVRQLEDEIIRIDDLVDTQIIARIEGLVARIEASQRRLVALLEQYKAGDRSVLRQIEALQSRLREDLRRVEHARAQLRKEIGDEFLNLDALEAMESRLRHEELGESLRRGDIDGALERARTRLDELRGLRDSVQERLAEDPGAQVSPQERSRLRLLRELSRLQDSARGITEQGRRVHQRWRNEVAEQPLAPETAETLRAEASKMQRRIAEINDARLDRSGRQALGDAQAHLRRLATTERALEAQESAAGAASALRLAVAGAGPGEPEAKALAKLRDAAEQLRERTTAIVPPPAAVLEGPEAAALREIGDRQAGIGLRSREVLDLPESKHLPEPGAQAVRQASREFEASGAGFSERRTGEALRASERGISAIQQALDSLRRTSPPPRGAAGPTSTTSERDRALRDEVIEAMREGLPEAYSQPVQRYYEELLR